MTSLTEQQRELVARNLSIVHWVICDYIHVNPTICGMEYGDLFQEGCLWLCKAAATYKNDGRAQFSTYAKTVVKNGLLSYCRMISNRRKKFSRLEFGGLPVQRRYSAAHEKPSDRLLHSSLQYGRFHCLNCTKPHKWRIPMSKLTQIGV